MTPTAMILGEHRVFSLPPFLEVVDHFLCLTLTQALRTANNVGRLAASSSEKASHVKLFTASTEVPLNKELLLLA